VEESKIKLAENEENTSY